MAYGLEPRDFGYRTAFSSYDGIGSAANYP